MKTLQTKHISQINSKTGEYICPVCNKVKSLPSTDLLWEESPNKPVFECNGEIVTTPFTNLGLHPKVNDIVEPSDPRICNLILTGKIAQDENANRLTDVFEVTDEHIEAYIDGNLHGQFFWVDQLFGWLGCYKFVKDDKYDIVVVVIGFSGELMFNSVYDQLRFLQLFG